jgi:DNA repair protein RadC
MKTGKIVGIHLLDHLILGADHDYVGFKERDLINEANIR